MDLTFRAGERTFSRRISRADWELFQVLRPLSPSEVALLVDVPDTDTTVSVPCTELLQACERITTVMRENAHALPYTYQYSRHEHSGLYSSARKSGIRFPGDNKYFYSLQAGLNLCALERWAVQRGRGVHVETRDVRDLSELVTSNMGTIRIRKTRAKTDVKRLVADLYVFLNDLESREVEKCFG